MKERIRATRADAIKDNKFRKVRKAKEEGKVIKELRKKPVYYVKADKRNAPVILDKEDHDNQMKETQENGPYRRLITDSIRQLIKLTDKVIKEC